MKINSQILSAQMYGANPAYADSKINRQPAKKEVRKVEPSQASPIVKARQRYVENDIEVSKQRESQILRYEADGKRALRRLQEGQYINKNV
jgi:hypothetical protein